MDKEMAIRLLRGGPEGVAAWNSQRSPEGERPNLPELDLSECDLRGADLRRVDMPGSNLVGADLRGADLREANLHNCDLTRADLRGANCERAHINGHKTKLIETRIEGAKFHGANFDNAVLEGLDVQSLEPPPLGAREPDSPGVFRQASFHSTTIRRSVLSRLDFSKAKFAHAKLEAVSFSQCRLRRAMFPEGVLKDVDFSGAALYGADFGNAELLDCDLQGVLVDQATKLSTVTNIQNTKIDRFTLLTLIGQGVLSEGQRMVMNIHDDVAKLRLAFGGFYRWLHLISLTLFLAPYVWFVVFHHIRAHFAEADAPSIPLASALWRYIVTGGKSWAMPATVAWGPVLLFAVALVYNLIRFLMLWRTASLEHKEQVTTLPQRWSLRDHRGWRVLFFISKWGVMLFAVIAVVNLAYYLWNPIPLPHGLIAP